MNKAVFIDKDGTLIPDVPYNTDPAVISLQPCATEGLRELQNKGFLLIIISNQAGVARGYFKEEALVGVEARLKELLAVEHIKLDGFYYCPHHPEGTIKEYSIVCDCRKPAPGLFLRAAGDFNIDLKESWMIGDILNDVEAGKNAGCRSILIDNGNETEWLAGNNRVPDHSVKNINEAALLILNEKHQMN